MELDLMVFGPHPDDAEIGLGGTIARHASQGYAVGICDLTRGELSSNGTVGERLAEAEAAREVLGATARDNLGWPDGGIGQTAAHVQEAVEVIRRRRPRTIAIPYWDDRHPDHGASAAVLSTAAFRSGLRRYAAAGEPWRADWVCYYFINDSAPPSFVIDVSEWYEKKRAALACHRTQFQTDAPGAVPTRLTSPRFRQLIESRDAQFGALAGVAFAEGLIVKEPILRPHAMKDWLAQPVRAGGPR